MGGQLFYITLAIVLALTFQPLRRIFEKVTDRIFFRDRYNTQEVLNTLGKILTSERLLEKLLHDSLTEICQNLRLKTGQFVILEKGQASQVTNFGKITQVALRGPELEGLGADILIADKLTPEDKRLKAMQVHGIQVSLPLYVRSQLVGFLLLGDKLSGSVYSRQDLNLLEVVAPELAVAISNAEAYSRIAKFNITLQQEIRRATHSLQLANQNLKALDRTKDEFLSITSHQLRTPLASIEGYLSLMLHGDVGEVPPQQKHFLESATEASRRMAEIVKEIVDISAFNAGRFAILKEPTDLAVLARQEVENLTSMAQSKGLKLSFRGPSQPLKPLELDKSKITQVIMNFIDNAIHYTAHGNIQVVLEEAGDDGVRLSVKDSGIGVPEAEQAKLFGRFFRGTNARRQRPDGSGLGLFLAKQVIEAHGGTIIFESKESHGSTFGFELPADKVESGPASN